MFKFEFESKEFDFIKYLKNEKKNISYSVWPWAESIFFPPAWPGQPFTDSF
jgi:hypothetical protein